MAGGYGGGVVVAGESFDGFGVADVGLPAFLDKWVSEAGFDGVHEQFLDFLDHLEEQAPGVLCVLPEKGGQGRDEVGSDVNGPALRQCYR